MLSTAPSRTPKASLRWLALAIWLLIALTYLAFFLADLRLDFAQLRVPCSGVDCNYLAVSQSEADVLHSWGLSLRTYSMVVNGATVLTVTVFCLLAVSILWSQKISRVGWFVSLALIIIPTTVISDVDNVIASNALFLIPSIILSLLGTAILFLFFYVFPSGNFYPRWAYIPFFISTLVFYLFSLDNLGIFSFPEIVKRINFIIIIALLLLPGGLQIMRYRKVSTPVERQQTKWIIMGMFVFFLGFILFYLFFYGGLAIKPGVPRLLASTGGWLLILLVTVSALPVTMAIAILRYRLWDIDLVIRRTLQYSLLTGVLVLVYFGIVVLLQAFITGAGGQQSSVVIVVSTLAIAALFNPLRLRIQDFIDRRFYRTKYNAEHALDQFALQARDEMDMDRLTAALLGLTRQTMQPDVVSLWLLENSGKRLKTDDLADL